MALTVELHSVELIRMIEEQRDELVSEETPNPSMDDAVTYALFQWLSRRYAQKAAAARNVAREVKHPIPF